MNIDPKDPKKADRDRFVLSKGHIAPGFYSTLAQSQDAAMYLLLLTTHQKQQYSLSGTSQYPDLSAADILTYLYFEEMNIDPKDPKKADRDPPSPNRQYTL